MQKLREAATNLLKTWSGPQEPKDRDQDLTRLRNSLWIQALKSVHWWLQGKMPNEFKFQWPLIKPKKVLIVMPIFFQLSKIRDKGREEVQLLATAGCASPENIFPDSLHDRRSSRQRPAENSDFVLSQQGVLVFFLACYLNSSPTSEGLWFGHRVKYRFKRPTLAWPQKASQLSLSRINPLISLLTSKQSSCSESG